MKKTVSSFNPKPVILIADDTLTGRRAIELALQKEEYQLALAADGAEALSLAYKLEPDIILLDVMMPGLNGYDVCQKIRSTPRLSEVPILMITTLKDRQERLKGIASGADDFISKPFDALELSVRVRTITRLNRYRKLREKSRQLASAKRELEVLATHKEHLHKLAMLDDLTKLHNRRSLFIKGQAEFNRARRYETHLSALMIDVDKFKAINDTYGHQAGSAILKGLAREFQNNLRSMDVPSRLGGDEFFILLPHTSLPSAQALAERLRKSVAERTFTVKEKNIQITISVGVATLNSDMKSLTELLEEADLALYRAKTKRNSIA